MTTRLLDNRLLLIAAAGIVSLGLVLGGYLLGDGLKRARLADRSVTVRGLAERDVTADLATWTIVFTEQGNQLGPVQAAIDEDTRTVREFLQRAGFKANEISSAGASVTQFFDSNRGENNVTIRQRLQLRTNDVMRARSAFSRQFDLIRGGVALEEGTAMVYSFTKLNDVKPVMIAAATGDARRGAEQFAKDSGTGVGGIKSATQGYFSITARDGENGGSGSDSPFQKVRVVTTIDFYLK
jgi:hypothetical protein